MERLMLKLQYFDHLMQREDSLEKTLILGKIEGERRRQQRMRWLDSITNLVDMNLSKLRETVEDAGAWQSMGSQRVAHDLATEQQRKLATLCHGARPSQVAYTLSVECVSL